MSIILDEFNLNINDFISKDDIQFNKDYENWEQKIVSEFHEYKTVNPLYEIDQQFRPEWKHKLSFVNNTNKKFNLLPKLIQNHIVNSIQKSTHLKFEKVIKLKNPYHIPEKGDYWTETEEIASSFSGYKTQLLMFALFQKMKVINQIDPFLLHKLSFSDEQINDQADLMAGCGRAKPNPEPREICPKYWRRQIRREINDTTEWLSNILGLANKYHPFVSFHTLSRYEQLWDRNKKYLHQHFVRNSSGDFLNLGDLVKSKAHSRNSMMYSITLGMSEKAEKLSYSPCFYTLTLPPEYHPNSAKYDTNITAIAQRDELQKRWHRVMAMVSKMKLRMFGLYTNEGHKDGTPHRHCLMYVHPFDIEKLNYCFRYHFPEIASNQWRKIEDGISVNLKRLDDYKGTVYYINKYIQKTISFDPDHDFNLDDEKDEDHLSFFANHKAWASSRRIRRYGFIGMKSIIGKWELIYKQRERPSGPFGHIWDKMQKGEWCEVLELLGTFGNHERFIFKNEYEERLNMYLETCNIPSVLTCHDQETGITHSLDYRPITWEIVDIKTIQHEKNYEAFMRSWKSKVADVDSNPSRATAARNVSSI